MAKPKRREFLHQSMMGAAVLAAGCTDSLGSEEESGTDGESSLSNDTTDSADDTDGASEQSSSMDSSSSSGDGSDDAESGEDSTGEPESDSGSDEDAESSSADSSTSDTSSEESAETDSSDSSEESADEESSSESGDDDDDDDDCPDPFEGGEMLGLVSFVGESGSLGSKSGKGHDARLKFDLAKLDSDNMICSNEEFYIRTEYPDQIDESKDWSIRIHGLVDEEVVLSLKDLEEMEQVSEVICLECSGNGGGSRFGLLSAAKWTGVPLTKILDMITAKSDATGILISGFDGHSHQSTHSTPGASWVFPLKDIADSGGMLALKMNDEPLPKDHGKPVRLMMPGWYGCCNSKWVDEIRLVDDKEPSTSQMKEFASRTHQNGTPALAKDFKPGTMHQAAMPVRIEKWRVDGEILYKIVGIMWGGYELTDDLVIELGRNGQREAVDVCPKQSTNKTWTLWSHPWKPEKTGRHVLSMHIDDPNIPTQRLDSGFYDRSVMISEI